MLYRFRDLIDKYGNGYQIKKKMASGQIIKRNDGLYADSDNISFTDVIVKKYPKAVITGLTAYYCYNLYDINPPVIHVASQRDTSKISNPTIVQHFVAKSIFKLGIINLKINNSEIKIYDKEKLLIELIRNKDKYSESQFSNIIDNYKVIKDTLDFHKINDYLSYYPNGKQLSIELEKYV